MEAVRLIFAVYRFHTAIRVIRWVGGTALAVALAGLLFGIVPRDLAVFFLGVGVLVAVLMVVLPPLLVAMARSGNPLARGNRSHVLDDDGIHTTLATAQSLLRWGAMDRVRETRRFFLLYSANQCVCYLPKQHIDAPEDVDGVRDLLRRRVGAGAPAVEPAPPDLPDEPGAVIGRFRWTLRELYRGTIDMSRYGSHQWVVFLLLMIAIVLWTAGPTVYQQLRRGGLAGVDVMSLVLFVFPLLLFLAIRPVVSWWAARRQLRTSAATRGEQLVVVTEEAVRASGGLYAGSWTWDSFRRIVETRGNLLFCIGKIQGMAVPLRAFPPVELDRLRSLIRAKAGERYVRRTRGLAS